MLFQTPTFFMFFLVFILCYLATRKHLSIQNAVVLVASYIFYGAWDERFLTLIIASTATDYLAGIGASGTKISRHDLIKSTVFLIGGSLISLSFTLKDSAHFLLAVVALAALYWIVGWYQLRLDEQKRRKFFILFSLVLNLGILAVFKYFNFFAESLQDLAQGMGFELNYVTLNIVLPVGISFYTFQTISYSVDIYRGQLKPTTSMMRFAAFVSFFPQLVAGPIERAAQLLPQFYTARVMTFEKFKSGSALFAWGMFKKVFIADNIAPIADRVFADPSAFSSGELTIGLLAFTFQIYCDFSGYSDMARGLARILGFELMLNFNLPYVSRTPSEFWQRWHISLSSWLRDYLYIPLGGNRGSVVGTYRNLTLTMLLGGLWHGASWTFVLWGLFHGIILVIYRILNVDAILYGFKNRPGSHYTFSILAACIMFIFTLYGWLIFRANTMDVLVSYTMGLFSFHNMGDALNQLGQLFYYIGPLLLFQCLQLAKGKTEIFWELPKVLQINIALFVLYCIVFLQPKTAAAFIYFDF